tara:strand:- start:229 stop:576 length:348 start_codon:yes stop_codon:yes gene_type:complete
MNKNKFNYKYEIQIKCPSLESYNLHLNLMDEIIGISKIHNVFQKVIDVDANNFLITWLVQFNSPKDQADAIIAAMALLSKKHVVPGQMIYQKELASCDKQMKEMKEILKEVEVPA